MLVSVLAPKEGISLLGLDGVPISGWINPLLSIKLENRKGRGVQGMKTGAGSSQATGKALLGAAEHSTGRMLHGVPAQQEPQTHPKSHRPVP